MSKKAFNKTIKKYHRPKPLAKRQHFFTKTKVVGAFVGSLGIFGIVMAINAPMSLEDVQKAVVLIEACNDYDFECGRGSGFAAIRNNYIITNYHVVKGATSIKIKTIDGVEDSASNVLAFNAERDIAILEWNQNRATLKIGSSDSAKVGDKVLAIGNPIDETNVVSEGIISSKTSEHGIMTTAAISPGSSGGALILDSNHKVIGTTYAKQSNGESMNYAVRIEDVMNIYNSYQKGEYFKIDPSTIGSCRTTLDKIDKDVSTLDFKECYDSKYSTYSANSITTFGEITNKRIRFEKALEERNDWKVIYDRLGSKVKNTMISNLGNIKSKAFNTNWKYAIWLANETFYYSCATDMCKFLRYANGLYPTSSEGLSGAQSDLDEL